MYFIMHNMYNRVYTRFCAVLNACNTYLKLIEKMLKVNSFVIGSVYKSEMEALIYYFSVIVLRLQRKQLSEAWRMLLAKLIDCRQSLCPRRK